MEHASVPVASLQLVGPRWSEAELLNAGRLVEVSNPLRKMISGVDVSNRGRSGANADGPLAPLRAIPNAFELVNE